MNKNEIIKKEIDYQISVKTHLWTAVIATSGATLALVFNIDNFWKGLICLFSFIFSLYFLNDYFNKTLLIRGLLNRLEDLEND